MRASSLRLSNGRCGGQLSTAPPCPNFLWEERANAPLTARTNCRHFILISKVWNAGISPAGLPGANRSSTREQGANRRCRLKCPPPNCPKQTRFPMSGPLCLTAQFRRRRTRMNRKCRRPTPNRPCPLCAWWGRRARCIWSPKGREGLYLIDQHAAHERILYEKFMAQRDPSGGQGIARQGLLEPISLHVGDVRAGLVAQHLSELNAVGFHVEHFGGDTFLVRAVPSALSHQDCERLLDEIVQGLAEKPRSGGGGTGSSAGEDGLQAGIDQGRPDPQRHRDEGVGAPAGAVPRAGEPAPTDGPQCCN